MEARASLGYLVDKSPVAAGANADPHSPSAAKQTAADSTNHNNELINTNDHNYRQTVAATCIAV